MVMRFTTAAMVIACGPLMTMAAFAQDPVLPVTQTVQQMFDAAAAATNAGDHEKALATLEALGKRVKNSRSLAIIRLRQGVALTELSRWGEARPLLEKAIVELPEDDESLEIDRGQAIRALGDLEMYNLDYEAARAYFYRALTIQKDPMERLGALTRAAQAGRFVDGQKALGDADQAVALAASHFSKDKALVAMIGAARGEVLLNLGRFAEAETAFAAYVAAEGGLTRKVDYRDLVARSNASIAALLAGHRDKARQYLIYTGAGRLPKQDFTLGADMPLPRCGEEGIRPDDVAVVEFGIRDDGGISYSRPIYGSRQGAMPLIFARAVQQWSWRPEEVAEIPALFRMVTRLELRCSVSDGGPSLADGARTAFFEWVEQRGGRRFDVEASAEIQRRASLVAELDRLRATAGSSKFSQAAALSDLLENPLVTGAQATAYGAALKGLLAEAGAPPQARLWSDWLILRRDYKVDLDPASYANDATAQGLAMLINYDSATRRRSQRSQAVLEAVLGDSRLPQDHPLRTAALIRRAAAKVAAKDMAGAQADYLATGLTEQQCSIVDAAPKMKYFGGSSSDYPMDMVMAGIEGWARIQYDVSSQGGTLNVRAVAAYPPMIFSKNATKMVSRSRFEPSYRPAGGLACSGSQHSIRFGMPN